jgi:6-phosphogluconolactonase
VAGVSDSPKPPPRRVTLTLGVLSAAREVAFVVGGAGKKPVVREIMEVEGCGLPGARVRPDLKGGRLEWFLDEAAAGGLSGRGGKL